MARKAQPARGARPPVFALGPASILALALGLVPTSARAECPVAGDLASGIRIDIDDGTSLAYRRLDAEHLEERGYFRDDLLWIGRLRHGVFEIEVAVPGPDGTIPPEPQVPFSYDMDIDAVVPLRPGAEITGVQRGNLSGMGGAETDVPFRLVAGDLGELDIGGCRYAAIPVSTSWDRPQGEEVVESYYLPELGLSFAFGGTFAGVSETGTPTAIAVSD
jgi:hypothetical protein